ncbi:MAG: hypothetical protein AAB389_03510 [Patescibacteria group bacterium]
MSKQSLALLVSTVLVLTGLAVSYSMVAQAQTNLNSAVSVKKQVDNGLFTISISDSDGIQEFSFQPTQGSRYGGELKCPTKFSSENVTFVDPSDFDPAMKVTITDCKKNIAEFEIKPLVNGAGRGILMNQPKSEPIPAPTPAPSSKTTESAVIPTAEAPTKEDIKYPVKELGNCGSEAICRTYCDKPDNYSQCFAFAKQHGLLEENLADQSEGELEELAQALKNGGPGGCKDQKSCEAYCNETSRMNECLAFAEKHQLMSQKDFEEAKKVQSVLSQGGTLPGGCKNKNECEAYCSGGDHIEECLAFAEKAGFLPPEELKQARKAMEFMAQGRSPGGCKNKTQCETYCEAEGHFEECIAFAEGAGFMSQEELAMVKKTGGKGPGGCRGRAQCESFCQDGSNFEQCLAFAEEHGLMNKKEAEMARKTGGKGPGGCKGKNECESVCQNPDNREVCFAFAKEHGLISEEELRSAKEGEQQFQNAMDQAPPEVKECLAKLGIMEGKFPTRGIEQQMSECFRSAFQGRQSEGGPGASRGEHNEEFSRQHDEKISSQFQQGGGQGGFPGGPIRCGTKENPDECRGSGQQGTGGGPGGCTNPAECQAYCESHPDECKQFAPPGGGGQGSQSHDSVKSGLQFQHSEEQSRLQSHSSEKSNLQYQQNQQQQHSEEQSRLQSHSEEQSKLQYQQNQQQQHSEEQSRIQSHDSVKSGAQFQHMEEQSKLQSQQPQQYPTLEKSLPTTSNINDSLLGQVLQIFADLLRL